MCTLAWLPDPGGFILWHSRDERRSRGPAIPPRVERAAAVSWIAPRDTDAGGTWIGVTNTGLVVGIANLFVGTPPVAPERKVSRGLLVRDLLSSPNARQVGRRVESLDLTVFEPFTLMTIDPDKKPLLLRWDGKALNQVPPLGPVLLVTSAGGSSAIEERRKQLFSGAADHKLTPDWIESLYRAPPDSEFASVCVHRPEVSTVSLTRIEVTSEIVSLAYTPGQPCVTAAGPAIQLSRVKGERRKV